MIKNMRIWALIICVFVVFASLVACNSNNDTGATQTEAPTTEAPTQAPEAETDAPATDAPATDAPATDAPLRLPALSFLRLRPFASTYPWLKRR